MNDKEREQKSKLFEINLKLDKAMAILNGYRERVYLDCNELDESKIFGIAQMHTDNGLLFFSAQDYIMKAQKELDELLSES